MLIYNWTSAGKRACFIEIMGLQIFNQPSRRLRRHPPLHREGKFAVYLIGYFAKGSGFEIYFFDSGDYADKKYK